MECGAEADKSCSQRKSCACRWHTQRAAAAVAATPCAAGCEALKASVHQPDAEKAAQLQQCAFD